MLNTPSVTSIAARVAGCFERERRLLRGGMRVALQFRVREARAIEQRGVVQPVLQHDLAAARERRDHTEIGHVSRREQQRRFATRESGQVFLELVMRSRVTGDEMRGASACSPLRGAARHRLDQRGHRARDPGSRCCRS